jgi:alpha-D-xyloside xylohydrolase
MDSTDPDFFNPKDSDYDHKAGLDGGTWRSLRNAFPLATVRGV